MWLFKVMHTNPNLQRFWQSIDSVCAWHRITRPWVHWIANSQTTMHQNMEAPLVLRWEQFLSLMLLRTMLCNHLLNYPVYWKFLFETAFQNVHWIVHVVIRGHASATSSHADLGADRIGKVAFLGNCWKESLRLSLSRNSWKKLTTGNALKQEKGSMTWHLKWQFLKVPIWFHFWKWSRQLHTHQLANYIQGTFSCLHALQSNGLQIGQEWWQSLWS